MQLSYYDKFVKAFKVYAEKCLQICHIIKMIAGEIPYFESLAEIFDLTIEDDKVLLSDIDRLMKPLKVNYKLLLDVKAKAEEPETYVEEIEFKMPKSSLLNHSFGLIADRVEMTDRQKRAHANKFKEMAKEAYAKRTNMNDYDWQINYVFDKLNYKELCMKFVVNVYEDYDASKIVADGVVGFDTQDWGDLITSVLNNKRIDVKKS